MVAPVRCATPGTEVVCASQPFASPMSTIQSASTPPPSPPMAMIAIFSGCMRRVSARGSALRALGHAAAIGLHLLGHVVGADAALPIAGHGPVDELRIRQIEPGHDRGELVAALAGAEPRVAALLLADR